MGQNNEIFSCYSALILDQLESWGALEMVNMVQNGHRGSPGTVLRGLVKVSGGPQRVHGVSWDGLKRSCEGLWRS